MVESKWYKLCAAQRKLILNGLSGSISSGQLTAVLGPSGAGKSTLIDCLIGKHERGLRGRTQVTFSDSKLEAERRKKRPLKIALIPQEDHLLDTLTVTETFMFASKIKNAHLKYEEDEYDDDEYEQPVGLLASKAPKKRRPFDHFANVQRVIQQLHLASCAKLRCGKLSGGQYKRVSIGQELLSRPDLMILDEPTSGLDSVTCYQTIRALRELIDESPYPMAIIATIHQPDVEVFNLFHKAYVLASGGRAVFEGAAEDILPSVSRALERVEARRKPETLASTLDAQSNLAALHRQLELDVNPARLIVELAAGEYGFEITTTLNQLQRELHQPTKDENQELQEPTPSASSANQEPPGAATVVPVGPPTFDYEECEPARRRPELDKLLSLVRANTKQRRSLWVHAKHFWLHTSRSWLTIIRDPMLFSVQVALHVFVPLLISYAFQNQSQELGDACPRVGQLDVVAEAYRTNGSILEDLNSELRVAFENIGYLFFQIYVIIFAAVCVTSLTYPLVMHVLLKEYRNGWYSMPSYFLGRTFADLPVISVNVYLAMAISYHLTGQADSPWLWRFWSVATLTVLATLVAQTWGLMFGALLMNLPQSAVFVAPASTAPLVVVSGFLIRIQSLPWFLQMLSQLSYFTHLLNGVIISRYGFGRCKCSPEDFLTERAHQVPQQARTIIDIWVESFGQEYALNNTKPPSVDLVGKLVDTISLAKTFGHQLEECSQVKPFTMLDYQLEDAHLWGCFLALLAMLLFFRWITYAVLSWKISSSL